MNYQNTERCENCINMLRCGMASSRDYSKPCWGFNDMDSPVDHMECFYKRAPEGCVCVTIDGHGHVEYWRTVGICFDPIAELWAGSVGDSIVESLIHTDIFLDPATAKRDLVDGKWIKGVSA